MIMIAACAVLCQPVMGVAALWEGLDGSDDRPRHCVGAAGPAWRPPGLAFLDTRRGGPGIVSGINLLSVVDASADPELDGNRALLTLDFLDAGRLRVFNESFSLLVDKEIGGSLLFPGPVTFPGESQSVLVPEWNKSHTAVFSLSGRKIREYGTEGWLPGVSPPYLDWFIPAVADFTGNGRYELVYANNDEWRAFDQDGELVARHSVLDPYDRGWRAWAQPEEDRTFIYLVTLPRPSTVDEFKIRIYKLSLEQVLPLPLPNSAETIGEMGGVTAVPRYTFSQHWMRELDSSVGDEALTFHDLNGDGRREIMVQHFEGARPLMTALTILDGFGEVLYRSPLATSGVTAVGDVNGDGIDEVVLMTSERDPAPERYFKPGSRITGVQWDGAEFAEIYHFEADHEFGGRWMSLCDFDGDGHDEIILALGEPSSFTDSRGRSVGDGKVKILDSSGRSLWEYRLFVGQPSIRPIVADFTGDGRYEIIIGNNAGQVMAFSTALESSFQDYEKVLGALKDRGFLDDSLYADTMERARRLWGDEPDAADAPVARAPMLSLLPALLVIAAVATVARRQRERP
jgi:hypothetical protein